MEDNRKTTHTNNGGEQQPVDKETQQFRSNGNGSTEEAEKSLGVDDDFLKQAMDDMGVSEKDFLEDALNNLDLNLDDFEEENDLNKGLKELGIKRRFDYDPNNPELGITQSKVNPNYYADKHYRDNCQRCVVAAELYMRGYDVEAQPSNYGSALHFGTLMKSGYTGKISFYSNVNMFNCFEGLSQEFLDFANLDIGKCKTNKQLFEKFDDMQKNAEEGSRYMIRVTYKGCRFGHVFNLMKKNGVLYSVDSQPGEIKPVMGEYFRNWMKFNISPSSVFVGRIDNKKINANMCMEVIKAHKKEA